MRYKLDNQSSFDFQKDLINICGPNEQSLSLTLEDFQRIAMALIEADRLSEFKLKAPYLEPVPELDGPQKAYNPDGSLRAFIWYEDGVLHRNGGPAVDCANGCREWWIKGEWQQTQWRKVEGGQLGKLHREDGPAVEYSFCKMKFWHWNGELHREDGPAVEYGSGFKAWYRNGKRHREDGPAEEGPLGTKVWFLNGERQRTELRNEKGQLHCEDGPAIEWANGRKEWWINDKLHREGGPAIDYADGSKEWYWYGREVTPEQHQKLREALCHVPNIIMGPVTPQPMPRKKFVLGAHSVILKP